VKIYNQTILLFLAVVTINLVGRAQSFIPEDTTDMKQVQNFEFISNGNIVLTSKAKMVEYGADFTNGYMNFERSLGHPFRSLVMEYEYTTEYHLDTALVRMVFKNTDSTEIGRMDIPVFEDKSIINISIANKEFIRAPVIELFVYSSCSPWIRPNSVLEIKSIRASNQKSSVNDNFKVYPNPSSTVMTIESLDGSPIQTVKIMSGSGAVMEEYTEINDRIATLNVDRLKSGYYFALIYSAGGVSSKTIIVVD